MLPISAGFLPVEHCAETKGRQEAVVGTQGKACDLPGDRGIRQLE